MDNKNLPAYPQPITCKPNSDLYITTDYNTSAMGFSKRETIAAMCLQGLLANKGIMYRNPNYTLLSTEAANYSDALLTHLSNTNK